MHTPIKAAILDMDGVLTRTATVHSKAWKQLFDALLKERKKNHEQTFEPFSIEEDYPKHLDGIPRYDGIERFLKSRGLHLPYGEADDPAGFDTICALGNKKNEFFQEQLEKDGVDVYEENIEVLQEWKQNGLPLAVISSSKNCKTVLERAGLLNLFEVRVDGISSAEKELKGKPEPDIFLEAADQLGIDVKNILVVEDARLGVQAAKAGGFSWIIGFSPEGNNDLLDHGASEVVDSLKKTKIKPGANDPARLSSAMDCMEEIQAKLEGKKPVFFFDYDGTLTPIVQDHTEAFISEQMRSKLRSIAEACTAGVVSGRGLDDVRERVGHIDGFYYVGSHGFEIAGPDDFYDQHEQAADQLEALDKAQIALQETFGHNSTIDVERKKFAIAVHYRNAPEESVPEIEKKVDELLDEYSLRKGTGKKIFELKPDVDWDKGRAIGWLMKDLKLNDDKHLAVYLGDDITDEDAFEAIRHEGIGILVGEHGEVSFASYTLKDVDEVGVFLDKVIQYLKEEVHG